jgi:hypothetical protein
MKWLIKLSCVAMLLPLSVPGQHEKAIGMELSCSYNGDIQSLVGVSLLKMKGGGGSYTYILNKYSTGLTLNHPSQFGHYLEYSSTVYIFQYGVRASQYFTPKYIAHLMPFIGISYFGKASVIAGIDLSTDPEQDATFSIGLNYQVSFSRFFRKP